MSATERLPECVCVGCTRPGTECGGLLCKEHAASPVLPDDPVLRGGPPTMLVGELLLMKERDEARDLVRRLVNPVLTAEGRGEFLLPVEAEAIRAVARWDGKGGA